MSQGNFHYWDSEFSRRFAVLSDCRWPTMKAAMNLMWQRGGTTIVETGCQRIDGDWGGGCSTMLLAEFAKIKGDVEIESVDINQRNVDVSISILVKLGLESFVTHTCGDSARFLHDWSVACSEGLRMPIDLLYLDSFDYPFNVLLDRYGGRQDLNKAIKDVQALPTDEVVEAFRDAITPCQEHCLHEIVSAMPSLHQKSIVLIDDNGLAGGGKSRLAKTFLACNGWECVYDGQQTLWIKP